MSTLREYYFAVISLLKIQITNETSENNNEQYFL